MNCSEIERDVSHSGTRDSNGDSMSFSSIWWVHEPLSTDTGNAYLHVCSNVLVELCGVARQTIEIDNELWRRFLKRLVDSYGSAYGSKKREALNEAVRFWLEAEEKERRGPKERLGTVDFIKKNKVSSTVAGFLGEHETVLPVSEDRKLLVRALGTRI